MGTSVKKNKLLMNIASLGSATLINSILSFTSGIITRNILGPEQFGYWLTISLIFTFLPIFQLGTLNAMNREVPFYLAKKDLNKVKEIREAVFSFIFTIPILLCLLLFLFSVILFFTRYEYEYKIGLFFAILIAFFTYLSSYLEMYYKSEQNFKDASRLISIKSLSQSTTTVCLVLIIGYTGLYIGMLLALIIEIFFAKELFPKVSRKYSIVDYKQLIRIGFPILIVGLVWSIMIATDRIIISIFMNAEDLGNYGVGMLVFSTMMLVPQVLSQIFYPKVVELVSYGDFNKIIHLYWKVNKTLSIIMLFAVLVGYFSLPVFVSWLMPEYTDGIRAAQILVIGIFPLTLVYMAANFLNATSNQRVYLLIQFICIISNIMLSILFLKNDKIIDAVALATSISFVIYSLLMNSIFWYKIRKY